MSVQDVEGEKVHYPKRRDVFQFDAEVASIFDDMAPRSIPMYNEVHRMHLSMLKDVMVPGAVVVDVGSSTGHLFRNIEREMGAKLADTGLRFCAIDSSSHMMERLKTEFPTVETTIADLAQLPTVHPRINFPADIMVCLYTLQFIEPLEKKTALQWLIRNTKIGGWLVLGQKESVGTDTVASRFWGEYHKFRRDNGYTQEEIDAKTEALKGSMWPSTSSWLLDSLRSMGVAALETSRWLEFSTVMGLRVK